MKIFISWSGDKSRHYAQHLKSWIKNVLPATDPWISPDIEKGAEWFFELKSELLKGSVGIVCLTMESKEKPWILFESGMLARGLDSNKLFTLLIDLKNEDVRQPLAQFNHTRLEKIDLKKLVQDINKYLGGDKLTQADLDKRFAEFWNEFEDGLNNIIKSFTEPVKSDLEKLTDHVKSLEDIHKKVDFHLLPKEEQIEIEVMLKENIASGLSKQPTIDMIMDIHPRVTLRSLSSTYERFITKPIVNPNSKKTF